MQRVALGCLDERRRETRGGAEQGRDARAARVGRRREVVLLVPEHLVAVQEVALVGHVVSDRQIRRRDRIDEQLEAHDRLARVAQVLADDGREVAAGRVAGDGEPPGVGAQQRGVRVRPARRGERVVGSGGEARLGRTAVADVEHDGARGVRQRPADRVVGLDRAEQPAAAVEVDDERPQLLARAGRPVRAGGDLAASDRDHMLGHGGDGLARPEPGEERLEVGARFRNRQEMCVRAPGRRDIVEQLPGHGVERHVGVPPVGSSSEPVDCRAPVGVWSARPSAPGSGP